CVVFVHERQGGHCLPRTNHSCRLEKVASSRSRGQRQGIGLANAPSPVTIGDRGRKRSPHHDRSAPRGARPAPRLHPTPKILGQETRRSTAQSVFQPATLRASYGGSRSPPSKPANPSYTRWRFFVPCEKPYSPPVRETCAPAHPARSPRLRSQAPHPRSSTKDLLIEALCHAPRWSMVRASCAG